MRYTCVIVAASVSVLATAAPAPGEAPVTAAGLGLMQGFPPPVEKRVTRDNISEYPYSRWAFQHIREMTGYPTPLANCLQDRHIARANLASDRTAGLEIAAGGQIERTWNLAGDDPARLPLLRHRRKHRFDESPRIGVLRVAEHFVRAGRFDRLPEIHDHDAI